MLTAPKFVRPALLMAALAGLSVTTLAAQDKKPATKSKSKADEARVVINQGKDGKYRFAIYSGKKYIGGPNNFTGSDTFEEAVEAFEEFKAVVNAAGKPVVGKKGEGKEPAEKTEPKEMKGKKKGEK